MGVRTNVYGYLKKNIRFTLLVAFISLAAYITMTSSIVFPLKQSAIKSYVFNHSYEASSIIGTFVSLNDSVDLRVIIITYNRPHSVMRLLNSLNQAIYYGDIVKIEIWMDRSKDGNYSQSIVDLVQTFRFTSGKCNLYIHPEHVGITGQWLTTWRTLNYEREIAVILEDDVTVSPYFYKYLKLVHKKYGQHQDVSGFSLQGKSIRHSDGMCCLNISLEHMVFLYPTLGTTGFSPNGRKWMQFQSWYTNHRKTHSVAEVPFVPDHISSVWYKSLMKIGKESSIWEMEYLFYTWTNKEYTLYPNFKEHRGLSFNWLENGLHYQGQKVADVNAENDNLVMQWSPDFENLPNEPVHVNNNGDIET